VQGEAPPSWGQVLHVTSFFRIKLAGERRK
jgi:hypothetical protein